MFYNKRSIISNPVFHGVRLTIPNLVFYAKHEILNFVYDNKREILNPFVMVSVRLLIICLLVCLRFLISMQIENGIMNS